MIKKTGFLLLLLLVLSNCAIAEDSSIKDGTIDQRSFRLGGFSSFAEMVMVGVKTLALSAAVSPEEMDDLIGEAERIAEKDNISLYREDDLIVTDLFPADVAVGKHVLLIYKGSTLDDYMALKERKAELVEAGKYEGEARKDIARDFGRLLSYPEDIIEGKINKSK